MKNKILNFTRFWLRKKIHGFKVSETPWMDEEGLAAFSQRIAQSKIYLEYGTGGSSVLASKHVDKIIAVDSDHQYMKSVARKIKSCEGTIAQFIPLFVSIGLTKEWGVPVFDTPTAQRINRWKRYPLAPWKLLRQSPPDTILVDGRFRVACLLTSLLELPDNSQTVILVDDYIDRPYYHCVEAFAEVIDRPGRMVVFKKRSDFDRQACQKMRDEHFADYR